MVPEVQIDKTNDEDESKPKIERKAEGTTEKREPRKSNEHRMVSVRVGSNGSLIHKQRERDREQLSARTRKNLCSKRRFHGSGKVDDDSYSIEQYIIIYMRSKDGAKVSLFVYLCYFERFLIDY